MLDVSPRVLIIRLDAIGDALALTPLLAALAKAAIPVDLVLRNQNAAIFSPQAARRMYVAPFDLRSNTAENVAAIAEFGAELRVNAYTHVLVATEDPGGYRLARATGATNRIGFANGWGKPLKTLWVKSMLTRTLFRSAGLDPRAPHECQVAFKLGHGIVHENEPTKDIARLRPLVIVGDPVRDACVGMQITDKWERLGIAFADVLELAKQLQALTSVRFFSAEDEREYAERLRSAAGIDIDYFDDLASWKNAIASGRALIAPDSGALHVAGMTGTPTVAIFPPIREFALQTARWSPWAAPYRIVKAETGWPSAAIAALVDLDSTLSAVEPVHPVSD